MKKELVLQKYYDIVGHDSVKAREEILKLPYRNDPYLLACIAQTYKDEGLFFKNGNQRKRLVKQKLLLAKKYIDKSFHLMPECRDVLYIKGEIYNALGERFEAMDCFIKIIENKESLHRNFNCSDSDLAYVKMLINDAHFQLYRLFKDSKPSLAEKFLTKYKKGVKTGISTIF